METAPRKKAAGADLQTPKPQNVEHRGRSHRHGSNAARSPEPRHPEHPRPKTLEALEALQALNPGPHQPRRPPAHGTQCAQRQGAAEVASGAWGGGFGGCFLGGVAFVVPGLGLMCVGFMERQNLQEALESPRPKTATATVRKTPRSRQSWPCVDVG